MSIKITSPSNPEIEFVIDLAGAIDDYQEKHGKLPNAANIQLLLPAYTKAYKNRRRVKDVSLDAGILELIVSRWDETQPVAEAAGVFMGMVDEAQQRHVSAVDMLKHQISEQTYAKPIQVKAKGFG